MAKASDDQFVAAWHACGNSPARVAEALGMSQRAVFSRRADMAKRGITLLTTPAATQGSKIEYGWQDKGRAYKRENQYALPDGQMLVFSDAHFWPDQPKTVAHEALLTLAKELKPRAIVANGDIFDGARVSRHAPLGWAELPSVKGEMEACEDALHELHMLAPRGCDLFWNVGNHDSRFDKMLVSQASEYEGVIPRLEDKFSRWNFAWSLHVNGSVMVKHRYHNGIHATYNNTLKGGKSIVTGHLHRLAVTPWADYNGRRWGVDTGTLSDPMSPQFDYGENNPTPHTSGFAVLTFKDGKLLPPELVEVIGGTAYFRGSAV